MGFVLEYLDDEGRAKNGFATEVDRLVLKQKRIFLRLVDSWVVDKERDAAVVCMVGNMARAEIELYWQGCTILAAGSGLTSQRSPHDGETGNRNKVDVHFEIKELVVSEELKEKIEEVKQLLAGGLEVYCWGVKDLNGKGYTTFSPTIEIRFGKNPPSNFKISRYSHYLTQN